MTDQGNRRFQLFLDHITMRVTAGKGGDGHCSFHREKYAPRGGPDGGDGGRGGHVIFQAEEGETTLYPLRYKRVLKADNGAPGEASNRSGKTAEDVVVKVPVGTVVRLRENGLAIADLSEPKKEVVIARGGRGGRGNARFAGPTNQAPRFSENGEPGEQFELVVELKLMADVGLVGFPNAGKSTLLSSISAARPKIADYPFTTITPNLGVASIDESSFVVADIPGLVEGAHRGVGLGHEFLRHIERTRLLLHMVDLGGWEDMDPIIAFEQINHELESYDIDLSSRPQIVVANKMDLPDAQSRWPQFQEAILGRGCEIFAISAATGSGIPELLRRVAERLKEIPAPDSVEIELKELSKNMAFHVERVEPGVFSIEGDVIWRRIARFNLDQEDSQIRLAKLMQKWGVEDALINAGVKEGDTVIVRDMEFLYAPNRT